MHDFSKNRKSHTERLYDFLFFTDSNYSKSLKVKNIKIKVPNLTKI